MNSLLLVEDDETLRTVLARAFMRRGLRVNVAASAEEALMVAPRAKPDFAVVDLKLPGDSGLKVVSALKKRFPTTRTVVLTGYATIATAIEAIKLGAVHYLAKPADAEQILEALKRDKGNVDAPVTIQPSLARMEWEHIQRVLAENDGNVSATARALKMHRRTLQRKLFKKPAKD